MRHQITDPARLLPGGFWTVELSEFLKCYVVGCYAEATIGRKHKTHGCVDACPGHDPARQGYDRPFYAIIAPAPAGDAPAPSSPTAPVMPSNAELIAEFMKEIIRLSGQPDALDGGVKAKLQPPTPKIPPSSGELRLVRSPEAAGMRRL